MSEPMDVRTRPGQRTEGHRCFAAFYDLVSRVEERHLMGRLRDELLRPLQGRVLEIGAGTGLNFPHYPETVEVVATEPDPFMLRRARKKLAQAAHPRLELRQAGAEQLAFVDHSFDHVVSTLVLCTVPEPDRALSEVRRVLEPDGRFHFIEHVRGGGWLGRTQDLVRPVWSYFAGGCVVNRRTGRLILDAGFQIERLRVEKIEFGIPILVGTARPPRRE